MTKSIRESLQEYFDDQASAVAVDRLSRHRNLDDRLTTARSESLAAAETLSYLADLCINEPVPTAKIDHARQEHSRLMAKFRSLQSLEADARAADPIEERWRGFSTCLQKFSDDVLVARTPSLGEWLSHKQIQLVLDEESEEGRVRCIRVPLTISEYLEIGLAGTPRYDRSFVPRELGWIPYPKAPTASDENEPLPPELALYIDDQKELVTSSLTDTSITLKRLDSMILDYLGLSDGTINIDRTDVGLEHPVNSVIEQVRAITTLQAPFPLRDTSRPMHSLDDLWSALHNADWSFRVTGALAMLKHLVHGRLRPYGWKLNHQGHFGFRVRTHDHTWLVGKALHSNLLAGTDAGVLHVHSTQPTGNDRLSGEMVAQVGQWAFVVWESRS